MDNDSFDDSFADINDWFQVAVVRDYTGRLRASDLRVEAFEFAKSATVVEGYFALFRVYRGSVRERVPDHEIAHGTGRGNSYRGVVARFRAGDGDEDGSQAFARGREGVQLYFLLVYVPRGIEYADLYRSGNRRRQYARVGGAYLSRDCSDGAF